MSLGMAEKLKVSPKIKSITVNDERHIVLKWSKVPLAEKYAVKRATEAGGEFEHLTWVKKCEFTDETAEENTTYWYKDIADCRVLGLDYTARNDVYYDEWYWLEDNLKYCLENKKPIFICSHQI